MSYINEVLAPLNEAQRDAATCLDTNSIVLSCPGSGKTKTVEAKVCNILVGDQAKSVCCLTFSKEAAEEMRARIIKSLGSHVSADSRTKRLRIGTFHSICKEIVERHLGSRLNIISESERRFITDRAIRARGITDKDEIEELASLIDSYPTMLESIQNSQAKLIPELYLEIRKKIHESGKVTFTDLLVDAVNLIESGRAPLLPFTHFVCDEGQDSDVLMYRFILQHAKAGRNITLMLDDDQTLYSFRNSLGVNVCRWIQAEAGARLIENATNYRSRSEVIAPSVRLINKNVDRIQKGIIPHRGPGGNFIFHVTESQFETRDLFKLLIEPSPGDWFILCRTNADVRQVCDLLLSEGIPFSSNQSIPLTSIKEVEAYLELLATLETGKGSGLDMTFKLCIANESALNDVHHHLGVESLAELLFIAEPPTPPSLTQAQRAKFSDLIAKAKAWRAALDEDRTPRAVRLSAQWITSNLATDDNYSVESAMSILLRSKSDTIEGKRIDLQRYIERSTKKKGETTDAVVVLTAHASKGLQRPKVLIWSLRQDSFPSTYCMGNSTEEQHIEEERRVLYVAMTRAEEELHLVFQCIKSTKRSTPTIYHPSPFLIEMGVKHEVLGNT